jgi:hypothetical protein
MRIDEEDDGGGSGCVGVRHQNKREEELDGEEFLSGRKLVQLLDSSNYISSFSRSASGGFVETRFSIVFFFLLFFFYY